MSKYKLYYSSTDETSHRFIEELENQGVDYDAVDITDSMKNLKEFLAFRENRVEFDRHKQWGQVGVPVVLLPNNRLIFDLIDLNGTSCSLTPRD